MKGLHIRWFAGASLAVLGAVGAVAQAPVSAGPDPYTAGAAAAMRKVGYVSLGPFEFGPGHTTTDVEQLLGDEAICWIETAHFRIGCALPPVSLRGADSTWTAQVKAELARLRQRLPKVPKSPRKLDSWLRAHLIAQRLEDCHAEIEAELGVDDARFPTEPGNPAEPDTYYGVGPYLGMANKFSVLIVRRAASLARYTRKYTGKETTDPYRMHYDGYGSLAFSIAEEGEAGLFANDHALHSHLVYNVTVNLFNGYRSYGHDLPPWLLFGLAHWHARRITPKYPTYEHKLDGEDEDSPFWKWDERALGLLRHQAFEPIADLMAVERIGEFGMERHIQSWFFVDFLMSTRRAETMRLMHDLKAPFHNKWKLPTHDELLERQKVCLQSAFGVGPEELEAAWSEWARKTGRRK